MEIHCLCLICKNNGPSTETCGSQVQNERDFWKDTVGAESPHGVRRKLHMSMVKNATEGV